MFSTLDVLTLAQCPGVGSNRLRSLVMAMRQRPTIEDLSPREIAGVEGFGRKLAVSVSRFTRSGEFARAREFAQRQLSMLNRIGGTIVGCWDEQYPPLLAAIYDPPPYLFMRGKFSGGDPYTLAIVGTRVPSEYGALMAEKFSREFARAGVTVVSGLARGIDTVAHSAALRSGGRTIAVIGSGLDVVYPPENRDLLERICTSGAVVSEFPMGTTPEAQNFPKRNRIISGLSLGTLVVETDLTGGAMITANLALDQNREVFAIPGQIDRRRSRGCHALIREGRAKLVESIEDIVAELGPKLGPFPARIGSHVPDRPATLGLFEQALLDMLTETPSHIDALAAKSGFSTSDALVNLLALEFKGLARQLPGKMFVRM